MLIGKRFLTDPLFVYVKSITKKSFGDVLFIEKKANIYRKKGEYTIQYTLQNKLLDNDIRYVDLGFANHSAAIYSMFCTYPEKHHSYVKRGLNRSEIDILNQRTKNALVKNFSENISSDFIISGEGIGRLTMHELQKMKGFLNKYFEEILIIGYVRTPMSYMESVFQQKVKGGINSFNIEKTYPEYRKRFKKFDKVFDKKYVELRKFDPISFPERNIVLDFCQYLGITIKHKDILRMNDSLTKEAVSVLYAYRKFGKGYGVGQNVISENKKLIKILSQIGKNKFKLSTQLMNPIIENNQEDIEWMEKHLGASIRDDARNCSDGIQDEQDLLDYSGHIVQELREKIGEDLLKGRESYGTAIEVAELIDILRTKLNNVFKMK